MNITVSSGNYRVFLFRQRMKKSRNLPGVKIIVFTSSWNEQVFFLPRPIPTACWYTLFIVMEVLNRQGCIWYGLCAIHIVAFMRVANPLIYTNRVTSHQEIDLNSMDFCVCAVLCEEWKNRILSLILLTF